MTSFLRKYYHYLVPAVAAGWLGVVFFLIPTIPLDDYWEHFAWPVLQQETLPGALRAFFTKSNEHTIFTAQFIYSLNYLLFRGSNQGLFLFNCGMLFVQVILVRGILRRAGVQSRELVLIVLLLMVSPVAIFHWVSSMSGTTWLLADTFFWLSLLLLLHHLQTGRVWPLVGLAVSSLLGALSYSTGLPILIALFLAGVVVSPRAGMSGPRVLILAAVCLALFYAGLFLILHSGEVREFSLDWVRFGLFFLSLVGSWFSAKPFTVIPSMAMGAAALVALFLALREFRGSLKERPLLGVVIVATLVYAFANYALMSYGRSGQFPLTVSLTSRYANISTIFWIGWVLLVYPLLQRNGSFGKPVRWLLVLLLVLPPYLKGPAELVVFHLPCLRQEPRAVRMILERDPGLLTGCQDYYAFPEWPDPIDLDLIDLLEKKRHVPFGP